MPYQPILHDGQVVTPGERDCVDRYDVIRRVLDGLDEPFTLLDLGAAEGYFSARIAADYPDARVTAIDPNPALERVASERVSVYRRRVNAAALRTMARHDVVLALSVLHHFAEWRQMLAQVRACRRWAIVEVPHPGEQWMRSAAARGELQAIHDAVRDSSVAKLGEFERRGRDGSQHLRPMYLLPGTVQTLHGRVFGGSGTNSRKMPLYSRGLDKRIGYQPVPGSLNLRLDREPTWGAPLVDWVGKRGKSRRDYQMWQAWIAKLACHAMIPGRRGHGPDCVEMLAPVRLRQQLGLADDATVTVDAELVRGLLRLDKHDRHYYMWDLPGKISACVKAGKPYEAPLLEAIRARGYKGVAVDTGANVGNHSLWLAAMCDLQVVAFEPIKAAELQRNLDLNTHLAGRVRVEPVALGAQNGTATTIGKGRLKGGSGAIPVRRLDGYELTDVAVIKVDVEGMESSVLHGAEKTIRRDRPVIYAEAWGDKWHNRVASVIEPWGYRRVRAFTAKESPTPVEQWEWQP